MSDAPTNMEDEEINNTGLSNLAYWDKFVIIVAALLFVCMVALFTMPSFGTALSNVLKRLPDEPETFHKSSPDEVVITVPPAGSKKPIVIPTPETPAQKK